MNKKEDVVYVAKNLAQEGYQMIELCGGFCPEWIHAVSIALDNKIPVGGVFYVSAISSIFSKFIQMKTRDMGRDCSV